MTGCKPQDCPMPEGLKFSKGEMPTTPEQEQQTLRKLLEERKVGPGSVWPAVTTCELSRTKYRSVTAGMGWASQTTHPELQGPVSMWASQMAAPSCGVCGLATGVTVFAENEGGCHHVHPQREAKHCVEGAIGCFAGGRHWLGAESVWFLDFSERQCCNRVASGTHKDGVFVDDAHRNCELVRVLPIFGGITEVLDRDGLSTTGAKCC